LGKSKRKGFRHGHDDLLKLSKLEGDKKRGTPRRKKDPKVRSDWAGKRGDVYSTLQMMGVAYWRKRTEISR